MSLAIEYNYSMLLRLILILGVLFFVFFGTAKSSFAHPFIPPEDLLQQFLLTNPDATTEDIQKWASEQDITFHATDSAQINELITKNKEQKNSFQRFFTNAFQFIQHLFKFPMFGTTDWLKKGAGFIRLGIEHIFTGFDHILFIVAMMLTFVSFKDIFKLTGTFTLTHSITLVLAGTLFLSISSRIVEPIIAFSIAYVALVRGRSKLLTVFLFGLVHGLGFAGVLKEIKIPSDFFLPSLLFFNLGIEIGQLLLISIVIVPILYLIRKTKFKNQIIRAITLIISIIGIYWGIERLLS